MTPRGGRDPMRLVYRSHDWGGGLHAPNDDLLAADTRPRSMPRRREPIPQRHTYERSDRVDARRVSAREEPVTQEKEKSKENCRPSWRDTNRDAQTSRKKSDTDDVGEDGDSWNERNHGNRGRVLGEHGLRNVSANQIFSTNGRDGEGEQKLALFNDLFHGFLTGCGKGVFRIATSPHGQ